jgi:16S rRNA (guanine1207-N2)-methyltransferase
MSSAQYFEPSPTVPSKPSTVTLALADTTLTLTTDRGVFAHGSVDVGTRLLLHEAPSLPAHGDLLDLGCGYGPMALTMARRAPGATVWAVDVNERAVALCAQNASANGLLHVRAVTPDQVPDDLRFAAMWSNPPIRIGKVALHTLLDNWLGRLAVDGVAVIVVHKHLGADSLAAWLASARGWNVERLAARHGYRVLAITPRSDGAPS